MRGSSPAKERVLESEFSFWTEVAKEAIASGFAALVLVVGAWITFFRTLSENRRKQVADLEAELKKQREDRREEYVTKTLVRAYQDLEAVIDRDNPLHIAQADQNAFKLKAEMAIRDIQLLGDSKSARFAHQYALDPYLQKDPDLLLKLFVSMRASLRDRLDLDPVDEPPSYLRFTDFDELVTFSDDALDQRDPTLKQLKAHVLRYRGKE
jgi:hypothetical protein